MSRAIVRVVDDNPVLRESLRWLLDADGLEVETYDSADDFLSRGDPRSPGCLLLDLRLPGMSGLELHRQLDARGYRLPVIFMSGHGDVDTAVEAMRAGATEFLTKPFDDAELLAGIHRALEEDRQRRLEGAAREAVEARLARLTRREREVLELVVAGLMNREIGERLHISPKTVEMHRARVMEKMQARTLAELVRLYLGAR